MTKYVKLNNNTLEYAPVNNGAILNYNLNEELMRADGYKELVEPEIPSYPHTISYKEIDNQIIKEYIKVEVYQETTEDRQNRFNREFLITSKGAFRLHPKGFANALQAIDFIDKQVEKVGSVTEQIAGQVIFYQIPDFTIVEQCTEDWLVAHQLTLSTMSKEDWNTLYLEISQLYITQQYRTNIEQ